MSRAEFRMGAKALLDGREHTFLRVTSPGVWQLEATDTGELRKETQIQLLERYLAGTLQFVTSTRCSKQPRDCDDGAIRQFECLSDERQRAAKARRQYVTTILNELGPSPASGLLELVAEKVWKTLQWPVDGPPHRITLWRWLKRYLPAGKDIRSLVDRQHRCGNRKPRIPADARKIIEDAIDVKYMIPERGTVRDVLDHAIAETARENRQRPEIEQLPLPRYRQVKRMIMAIPAFDRYAARYGRLAADRHFHSVLKQATTSFALERVEIDHTPMDVFVIDDETMLPLGRPWLTLCIDKHTRTVLGFDLSFDPPSYLTVSRCLKMALLPKGNVMARYPSIRNTWDMYGVMETLVVDNGLEFHSKHLEAACLSLGITIQYCPRKQPWFKGAIERMLGTLNRGVAHGTPGTTFSNIVEKEDYEAAKKATVTLETLREAIYTWIVDYYHQRPHKGLGDVPAHAWQMAVAGMPIPVPSNPKELDATLGKVCTRRLTQKGIELHGLFYNGEDAAALVRKLGTNLEVTVRHQDDDLGVIYILVPDSNVYVPISAIALPYASGLTLWQHNACKRYAKENLEQRTDIVALAEAKRRITELVERDFGRKRGHRRARPHDASSRSPASTVHTKANIPALPASTPSGISEPSKPAKNSIARRSYSAIKVERTPLAV